RFDVGGVKPALATGGATGRDQPGGFVPADRGDRHPESACDLADGQLWSCAHGANLSYLPNLCNRPVVWRASQITRSVPLAPSTCVHPILPAASAPRRIVSEDATTYRPIEDRSECPSASAAAARSPVASRNRVAYRARSLCAV